MVTSLCTAAAAAAMLHADARQSVSISMLLIKRTAKQGPEPVTWLGTESLSVSEAKNQINTVKLFTAHRFTDEYPDLMRPIRPYVEESRMTKGCHDLINVGLTWQIIVKLKTAAIIPGNPSKTPPTHTHLQMWKPNPMIP